MTFATAGDLAAFLQVAEVDTYTANLMLDGAAALMVKAGAPVLIDPVPDDLRIINVAVAAGGYTNPKVLRSVQESVGSVSRSETTAGSAAELGLSLSQTQKAVCATYRPRITSVQLVGEHEL